MGFLSSLVSVFQKPGKASMPGVPEYYTDPNFSGSQDFLKSYSENLLKGNIPDYYKAIGETAPYGMAGDYVSDMTRDMKSSALEQAALAGTGRSALGTSNIVQSVGNLSGQLRYADYLRAMEGKQWLMNMGMSGEEGVREAAYGNMGQKNAYDQWQYGAQVAAENARLARRREAQDRVVIS